MEQFETPNAELVITFGKAWYKLVGKSVALGAATAIVTYVIGRGSFKDAFNQVEVYALENMLPKTNQKENG